MLQTIINGKLDKKKFDNLEILSKKNPRPPHAAKTISKFYQRKREPQDKNQTVISFQTQFNFCISGLNQSADKISQNVLTFTPFSLGNMRTIFTDFLLHCKYPSPLKFKKFPISKTEQI